MSYDEIDFEWACPKCGESGRCCLERFWKYCPYCGSELKIEVIKYDENSGDGIKWEYEIDSSTGLKILKSDKDPDAVDKITKLSDELFKEDNPP